MTTGYHPDGTRAFTSRNLAGLIRYACRHGMARAQLWSVTDPMKPARYHVTFGNGVTCDGAFASRDVMLGFFLSGTSRRAAVVEVEREVWNQGTALGNAQLAARTHLPPWGRSVGGYHCQPYRQGGVAMVRCHLDPRGKYWAACYQIEASAELRNAAERDWRNVGMLAGDWPGVDVLALGRGRAETE